MCENQRSRIARAASKRIFLWKADFSPRVFLKEAPPPPTNASLPNEPTTADDEKQGRNGK